MFGKSKSPRQQAWLVFGIILGVCLAAGAFFGLAGSTQAAAPAQTTAQATPQAGPYVGDQFCARCHQDIHTLWQDTRHANAFSSPIFQRDWTTLGAQADCLQCHTTGYDPTTGTYAFEGVTCESCHGPFQPNHPQEPMPIKPDADLCASCHKTTTDEWRASKHAAAGIQCQSCHNPHAQQPKAASISELCSNCHQETGGSFTHSTHANAGLQCSNCHMYTAPRTEDPVGGLVATGHTFSVGSDACIGCHQDTVHTRDKILALEGEVAGTAQADPEELRRTVQDQEQQIANLSQQSTVRLYTGLAQGAIVGLITGGAAAWVVGRRVRVVQEGQDE
jgi:Cytochrome c554 and c-prime/Doubled CXXCH motif (Paired_CXXCH_1)